MTHRHPLRNDTTPTTPTTQHARHARHRRHTDARRRTAHRRTHDETRTHDAPTRRRTTRRRTHSTASDTVSPLNASDDERHAPHADDEIRTANATHGAPCLPLAPRTPPAWRGATQVASDTQRTDTLAQFGQNEVNRQVNNTNETARRTETETRNGHTLGKASEAKCLTQVQVLGQVGDFHTQHPSDTSRTSQAPYPTPLPHPRHAQNRHGERPPTARPRPHRATPTATPPLRLAHRTSVRYLTETQATHARRHGAPTRPRNATTHGDTAHDTQRHTQPTRTHATHTPTHGATVTHRHGARYATATP